MTEDIVISVENVSMNYNIYRRPSDLLKEVVFGGVRHDTFWALRDVSLQVREKERIGIIGPNGAGKSTLLQVIAGNLTPTRGTCKVKGSISSLLSLVPAWNAEESGIENIRFNLLLQGTSREKIAEYAEEIIDFTELGPFIYQPVKTYSSGMSARLSFAIATAVSPEILIIDEVLGAGDGYFASKATRRMREMCDRGKALLFVSHSTSAIRMLCNEAIWIENGGIRHKGPTDHVLFLYEEDMVRRQEETQRAGNMRRLREQLHMVTPEDIGDLDLVRLRLRSEERPGVRDTHYVRALSIQSDHQDYPIPLEFADLRQQGRLATMDLSSCEWGRLFTKNGADCRLLTSRTGARKGGHILAQRPRTHRNQDWPIRLSFESQSIGRVEKLIVDWVDVQKVMWSNLVVESRERLSDGWERTVCSGTIAPVDEAARDLSMAKAQLDLTPPVSILDIGIFSKGERVNSVREREPFSLRVTIEQHKPIPESSVNLSIVRSDGVYAFWQASEWFEKKLVDFSGKAEVEFRFDENLFGSGDYAITVMVVNGWSFENVPPSEIFDRRLGTVQFRVHLENSMEVGLINRRVAVTHRLFPKPPDQVDANLGRATFAQASAGPLPGSEPNVEVLSFPPPYRRMVAINSDVEWTTWPGQIALVQQFHAAGLEASFSYWCFSDPGAAWRLFESDGSDSPHTLAGFELIRSGLCDVLHSFGGIRQGAGCRFGRPEIEMAYRRLEAEGITTRVYSNHGGYDDIQNIGGPWVNQPGLVNYQQGDLPGAAGYHLDLTSRHGVRFYWTDIDRSRGLTPFSAAISEDETSLFVPQIGRDGTPMLRFRRSDLMLDPVVENLGPQISQALAQPSGGYLVIYTHLGANRLPGGGAKSAPLPCLTPDGVAALQQLAAAQAAGDVLVTTSERLLSHALIMGAKPWTIAARADGVEITFQREFSYGGVSFRPEWSDLAGFAVAVDRRCSVIGRLGAETRALKLESQSAGRMHYGFGWARVDTGAILERALRHAPITNR